VTAECSASTVLAMLRENFDGLQAILSNLSFFELIVQAMAVTSNF
jgi:hypothetical protein